MSITFNGYTFLGIAEEVRFGTWELMEQYTSAFGVPGQSSLDGGKLCRDFSVRIVVYGEVPSATAMWALLGAFDAQIGFTGAFVDDGLTAKAFSNVKMLTNQLEEGPLPTGPDGGWLAVVNLGFRQLSP